MTGSSKPVATQQQKEVEHNGERLMQTQAIIANYREEDQHARSQKRSGTQVRGAGGSW